MNNSRTTITNLMHPEAAEACEADVGETQPQVQGVPLVHVLEGLGGLEGVKGGAEWGVPCRHPR